ncbi:MAG: glycosyltransferase family 4 protein [Candidatus Omnitrophota bacterium]|jgi:glycosyltransferase involved in cell wall biosynthesis
MQKLNLLYVITKLELGGAQKQLLSLISSLDKERFNLFLFTAKEGMLIPDALSVKGLNLKSSRYLERPINFLKDFLALIEIYRFIKKNNIAIVHTHSSKAGILGRIAARLAGVKSIIHTVHGWPFNDYQQALFRRLFILMERLAGKFTSRLIVVSCHDRQKGLKERIGREDKYSLIRYGIDKREFSVTNQGIREKFGISSQDLIVTNISCFKPQKSPLDFIKLAYLVNQALPGVKFLLVGDGALRKKIENLVLRLNLQNKVILTGWRRDIPEILSVTDVLALTSLWEGLPIVVLEAMAAGCPAVVTATGGVEEAVIDGKTGFMVAPGDIREMSEKLLLLLKDAPLRKITGQNARFSLDSDFRLEKMLENNRNLYENLLGAQTDDVN